MGLKDLYLRFIAVRRCGGCGEILSFDRRQTAFCSRCQSSWSFEKNRGCGECLLPARECGCMPSSLARAGALCLRRLFFYEGEDSSTAGMRMIYLLKRKANRRMSKFVASELEGAVRNEMSTLSLEKNDIVVSWVPRGRVTRNKAGFDQSELVARELATLLEADCDVLLRSSLFAKEQKRLDKRQRLKNARANIRLARKMDISGKYVILYDDMVTTGASMSTCVSLLKAVGAKGVMCFSMSSRQILGGK